MSDDISEASTHRTHCVGDGCREHPLQHHGACVRALDGDCEPLAYCAICYLDMAGEDR